MAVYFIPKTKLIPRVTHVNISFRPKNWSKWTRRNFMTSHHYYSHEHGGHKSHSSSNKGGWLSWQGVFFRWTPIGICIIAATQWHLHNRECIRNGLPRTAPAWQTNVYCSLPLRLMSRCFGWVAERNVPESLRPIVYGAYISMFGVNIDQASVTDLKYYNSLSQFFTRSIRSECRAISTDCIVSPCDGRVLHFGPVTSATHLEQIKGITYSLESFFGPRDIETKTPYIESLKKRETGTRLYHCIFYLAPGDYHKFHSPAFWTPAKRRHFHGELLSVSPKIASIVPGLFCINERVAYMGEWEHGFFSFTAVGATNVGSVQVYVDDSLKTNIWRGFKMGASLKERDYEEANFDNSNIRLSKGELVGQFNMGSTIVLVFEAPENFRFNLEQNGTVKVGQSLGYFCEANMSEKDE